MLVRATIVALVALVVLAPGRALAQAPADSVVTLTLDAAVRTALTHALPLRTSRLDVEAAEGGARLATGTFDPILSLNPTLSRADGTVLTQAGGVGSRTGGGELSTVVSGLLPTSTQYSLVLSGQQRLEDPPGSQTFETEYDNTLSLTLTQPLLRGFGGAAGLDQRRAADLVLDAAEARHDRQVEILLANVETLYYQLAQREAEERVARESLARASALLARNEELRDLERISGLDLVTSRSGVASRRTALTTAIRLRENAADALVGLIYGEEAPAQLHLLAPRVRTAEVDVDVPTLPAIAAAEALAIESRADVEAARRDVRREEVLLGVAENGLLPALDVSATYTTLGSNTADFLQFGTGRLGDFTSNGWSGGVAFSWPVGNRRARGAVQQTRAFARQSLLFLVSAENVARLDARAGHRGITFGQEAYEEASQSLALARELYEGETERHRLGLTDSFRLLQVEDQVSQAYLQEIGARFGLYSAVTQYRLAIGGVLLDQYGAGR